MKPLLIAALCIPTCLPLLAPAQTPVRPRVLALVDEGGADASWVQFRATLQGIIHRGDRRALAGIVDTNILNAMEAPRGIATFRKLWDLDGKDERLLRELSASLQLGSAWYQPKNGVRMLCAPYVPIKWPLNDYDPYQNGVIIARDTLMKSQPSQGAETVGRLNYDIVNVRDWEVADRDAQVMQRWVKIRRDGKEGYVPEEHIRSAIEHRACFGKTTQGWRLMEYVLGIEYLGVD
jgi:hypothetical protein